MDRRINHDPAISSVAEGGGPSTSKRTPRMPATQSRVERASTSSNMDNSLSPWLATMRILNDIDETTSSFPSNVERGASVPGRDAEFVSSISFWNKETLINCACGAPPSTYCICLPTSLDYPADGDYFDHSAPQQTRSSVSSVSDTPSVEPRIREDGRPAVPTRKERRRQQNRAAQVRHRDKRNRFLHETLRNIESLNQDLKEARAQRDYFRLMYEDLETKMLENKTLLTSRIPDGPPGSI